MSDARLFRIHSLPQGDEVARCGPWGTARSAKGGL